MAIAFACPGCHKDYRVPDEFAGRTTRCRQCGADLSIPSPEMAVQVGTTTPQLPPPVVPLPPAAPLADSLSRIARPRSPARLKVVGAGGGILLAGLLLFWAETALVRALFSTSSGRPPALGQNKETSSPLAGVRYLPDHCQIVVGGKIDEFMASAAWKEVEKEAPEFRDGSKKLEEQIGVPPANIRHILRGQAKGPPHDPITVFTTRTSVNARDMLARIKNTDGLKLAEFQELKLAGRTVYQRKYARISSSPSRTGMPSAWWTTTR